MGFTGSVILANSRLPLDELDAIVERDDDLYIMIDFRDGWKLGGIFESAIENDAENMLAELVQATGMPAMTGYVIDSDCVDLKALSARSGPWRACLIRAVMADYSKSELGLPFESTFLPPEVATVKATAWAFEAGLEPDQEGLSALFADEEDDRDGLSEFHRLIQFLGVPGPGQRRY